MAPKKTTKAADDDGKVTVYDTRSGSPVRLPKAVAERAVAGGTFSKTAPKADTEEKAP